MRNKAIERFGFCRGHGGVHLARTIMLAELKLLFSTVIDPDAAKSEYLRSIVDDNCLAKRSDRTRKLTARHLSALYALDPDITLFRCLRYFWQRDPQGRPLLAMICAVARDPILRLSIRFVQGFSLGQRVTRGDLEVFIDNLDPGRFSPATLKSAAQNINSSWTQSGHLQGKKNKIRSQPLATPGAVSYALLLGYLSGDRGESLYRSEYATLLDCPVEQAIDLSVQAAGKGWIVVKRLGSVIEVLFPNLLAKQEMEWVREQN